MMCSQSRRWQGPSAGFQWPSVTFPDSTPHPPPFAAAVSTKRFSRHLLPRVTWSQASLFSLARAVGLRLTRSLVLLKSTHFQILKKKNTTMKFIQKEKNMRVKSSKEVSVQLPEIPRRPEAWTDNWRATLPSMFPSPSLINVVFALRPFLPHNFLLARTYACLPCTSIPGRPLLRIVSRSLLVLTPLPVWSFLFASLHFSCKLLIPASYPSDTCKLIVSLFSETLAPSFKWSILNSRQSWGLEVGEERKRKWDVVVLS